MYAWVETKKKKKKKKNVIFRAVGRTRGRSDARVGLGAARGKTRVGCDDDDDEGYRSCGRSRRVVGFFFVFCLFASRRDDGRSMDARRLMIDDDDDA